MRPFQRQVLEHLGVLGEQLEGGPAVEMCVREVLSVQPTGSGKSVCFQAAAAMLPGTTLVVSPLVSLMFDQVDSMRSSGIRTATINSMQTAGEREDVMAALESGSLDLLYTSPEQLDKNQKLIRVLSRLPVPLLAVDEAHCISSWGHDFRPSYRRITPLRDLLGIPRLVALTASAPPIVRDDIAKQLGMAPDHLRLVASCRRPNIQLSRASKSLDSVASAVRAVKARPALVYTQTRKDVDLIAEELARTLGPGHVLRYHAGLSSAEREESQEAFQASDEAVMVATNAFGMGIDKASIRTVVHYGPSGSIEAYYQELGRAGRDGKQSKAVLMRSEKVGSDLAVHKFFLSLEHPSLVDVSRVWSAVRSLSSPSHAARGALDLACSVKELSDETAKGGRKVGATSKCVRVLEEWGYLERLPARTTVTLYGGADLRAALKDEVTRPDTDLTLPIGMRKGTQQAKAWAAIARRAIRPATLSEQGAAETENENELVRRDFETEAFDTFGLEAGLEPRQFANALTALQSKRLVKLERTASLLAHIPAAASTMALPDATDERSILLAESRKHGQSKLNAIEQYLVAPVPSGGEENDALWQFIMRYFGETLQN